MIFLSERIPKLSKTKLLKLLYILDEISISKSGLPFFNLQYKVWKLGPVSEEIFIELSDTPVFLREYIKTEVTENNTFILPKSQFNDDEFSDYDMELLNQVVNQFKNSTAAKLVDYTHRLNSPWRKSAEKNDVLQILENGEINNIEIIVDMSVLINHDERKKDIFEQYTEEK